MTYLQYKDRVAALINRDDLGVFLPSWVNEARDEVASSYPFSFLWFEKQLTITASAFSYEFDAGATGDRYSGVHNAVMFYNGSSAIKLSCLGNGMFDRLYPNGTTGDPVAYTVRGTKFYVNAVPASVTNKKFYARYYELPDALSADGDEKTFDKKMYQAVLDLCCFKAASYTHDLNAMKFWNESYNNNMTRLIKQDQVLLVSDIRLGPERVPGEGK